MFHAQTLSKSPTFAPDSERVFGCTCDPPTVYNCPGHAPLLLICKYAHLICSTCTARLCQGIWPQQAYTSVPPHPYALLDGGCGRPLAMMHAQHALAIKHVRQARLLLQHVHVGQGSRVAAYCVGNLKMKLPCTSRPSSCYGRPICIQHFDALFSLAERAAHGSTCCGNCLSVPSSPLRLEH